MSLTSSSLSDVRSKEDITEWPISVFLRQYGEYAVKEQCNKCMAQLYSNFRSAVPLIDEYDVETMRKAVFISKNRLSKLDVRAGNIEDMVDIVSKVRPSMDEAKDAMINWEVGPHLPSHKLRSKKKWFPKFPTKANQLTQETYKRYVEKVYTECDKGPWIASWVALPVLIIQFFIGVICLIIVSAYAWRLPTTYVYQWLVTFFVCLVVHVLILDTVKCFIIAVYMTFSIKCPICPTYEDVANALEWCCGWLMHRKKKRKKLFWF